MVENNTLTVDAISGATCTSNAVIAGAIEAWMQIMTERMSQEEWMESANTEPVTGGWGSILHEAVELPQEAQAAFDKAVEGLVGRDCAIRCYLLSAIRYLLTQGASAP